MTFDKKLVYRSDFVMENGTITKSRIDNKEEFKIRLKELCSSFGIQSDSVIIIRDFDNTDTETISINKTEELTPKQILNKYRNNYYNSPVAEEREVALAIDKLFSESRFKNEYITDLFQGIEKYFENFLSHLIVRKNVKLIDADFNYIEIIRRQFYRGLIEMGHTSNIDKLEASGATPKEIEFLRGLVNEKI